MMLSVDEINKLQKENEHWQQLYQNEHCELLQVKEEQRLFALEAKKMIAECSAKLEWYKQSEQEANEIIAELKAENAKLEEEITELEEKFLTLNGKSYSYYLTLQEIKTIAEKELSYDMVGNEHRHYKNYDIIRHLITEAGEE